MTANYWLPRLVGSSLILRPIAESDFDGLFAAASDPDIWALHSEKDRYKRDVFKKFFDKAAHPPAALVIVDNATNEIIGSSRYYDFNDEDRSVVVGYTFLAKQFWGGLVNKEIKQLMLDHAFQKVDTVIFHASEGNLRSHRAIEKLGAKKSLGTIELPGVGRRVEYRLTKVEWCAKLKT